MQTKTLIVSTVILVGAAFFANPTILLADERQAVEEATAQFYTSLNTMFTGNAGPMQEIWSHADDVTYLGPTGEFQVGWNEVRDVWEAQAALHLGGKVEPYETRVTVGDDLAFTQCTRRAPISTPKDEPCKFRSEPRICSARRAASGR